MRILFLFLISLLLVACDKPQPPQATKILINQDRSYPSTDDSNETSPSDRSGGSVDEYGNPYSVSPYTGESREKRRRSSCNNYTDRKSSLTVERLIYIDAHNLSDYLLKGRCESGERINISINGYPIDKKIYCKSRKWELTVDLTPLANEEVVSFEISSLDEVFCEDIKVAFTSPKNYLAIPALEDYYEAGFLVMKYEAKLHKAGINSKAVSETRGRPISSVSYSDAEKLCSNNGSRYDLMSNSQWQNIARDIESVDENWSLEKARVIEGNNLNCGVTRGIAKEASKSDEDDCGSTSCDRGWDYHRRTHLLSSGERIWDMCGNVGEVMRDKYTERSSFTNYTYHLKGKLKDLFGPDKKYDIVEADRREGYFGLGYTKVNRSSNLIVRGSPSRYPGIFSADVTKNRDGRAGHNVGFRCVYLP